MPNLFETKTTILRPRAVKVQSPPYPVTGAEDDFIGVWSESGINLKLGRYSIYDSGNLDINTQIGVTSTSIILEESVVESSTIDYTSTINVTLDSILLEVNDQPVESGSVDHNQSISVDFNEVVVPYDHPVDSENITCIHTIGVTIT